jgi:hypothetical protein
MATIRGNSLDALDDVVSDWFIEHWGDKVEIYLRGVEAMRRCRRDLMDDITDVLSNAIDNAASQASEVGRVCDEAVARERIKIFFCFT